ncbi:hypothetical protein B0H10DRAFT_2242649 [Mycena sp. CBHHK59/15]|nr:hypothetical protein B0H10DRAFT_2242649 [Mycena sp. CBHHK59/15]
MSPGSRANNLSSSFIADKTRQPTWREEAYISETDLAYLLGFPYLCSEEEIQNYYTFCAESTNAKVQNWWTHKMSYPWLLPSLNREVSQMDKRHWDLTPRDTNPIEGSHAQDNQVNSTRRSLLDAILLAKKLDSDTARVIKATMTSGVLENPNNSLQSRFKNQSQRQARTKEKQRELESLTGREAKKLRAEVKAGKQQAKDDHASQPHTPRRQSPAVAGPSRLTRYISTTLINNFDSDEDMDDFAPCSPPTRMQALELFPGLRPMTPVADPRSDFDYAGALKSDILDKALRGIAEDHPMYPVNGDDEVLASDPYVVG